MYASPSNNYWIVGDQDPTVRWSSASVVYVADSDSTYTAWLADGFEVCIIATEQELADLLNATYPAGSPIPLAPQPVPGGPVSVAVLRDPAGPALRFIEGLVDVDTLPAVIAELAPILTDIETIDVLTNPQPLLSTYTGSYTVPAGVYKLLIFGQASGGGGGGVGTAGSNAGGGGGAGETRVGVFPVNPGDVIDFTIGAPGLGGNGASSGTLAGDLIVGGSPAPAPAVRSNSISDTVNNGTGVATLTFPVALPLGIVSGDLLVIFIRTTAGLLTTPAGWTLLGHTEMPTFTGGFWCFYRVATGSEGVSVTVTSSVASGWYNIGYCITGHDVPAYAPLLAAAAAANNNKPNPPSLNATALTAVQKLWLAAAAASNSVSSGQILSGLPSGFHNPWGPIYPQTYDIASQYESNVAVVDPTNYLANGAASSTSWVAFTLAIKAKPPIAMLLCKGGTGGSANTGTGGTTPVGSGGARIPPAGYPFGAPSAAYVQSVGGSSFFGVGVNRVATTGFSGLAVGGPGAGGGGAGNGTSSGTARDGADGSPGMILIIGFGQ
jgi:hypothetical protein